MGWVKECLNFTVVIFNMGCLLTLGAFCIFEHKIALMNTNTLSQNILQGLADLPVGQIYILTGPLGLTSRHIYIMEFILSMAKQYDKPCVIHSRQIDYSDFSYCCACKIEASKGAQLLIADKDSLVELLCEFWGMNHDKVCKTISPSKRYKKIAFDGSTHPIKTVVPLMAHLHPSANSESGDVSLELLQTRSKDYILDQVSNIFKDVFNYHPDIELEDIIKLYNQEKSNIKTYALDIEIDRKEEVERAKLISKIKKCDISLIDNKGTQYPLKFEAEWKVIYLTYLCFPKGLYYCEVNSDNFFKIYKRIHSQMPRVIGAPKRYDLEDNSQMDTFANIISKIRKTILKATNDNRAVELFAIDGYEKKTKYKIQGATDDNREKVRKEFNIK